MTIMFSFIWNMYDDDDDDDDVPWKISCTIEPKKQQDIRFFGRVSGQSDLLGTGQKTSRHRPFSGDFLCYFW